MDQNITIIILSAIGGAVLAAIIVAVWMNGMRKRTIADWTSRFEAENALRIAAESALNQGNILLASAQTRLEEMQKHVEEINNYRLNNEEKLKSATSELAAAENEHKNLRKRLDEQAAQLEDTNKRLTTEFENLASRILDQKVEKFTTMNSERLGEVITPFREKLREFEAKIDFTNKEHSDGRAALFERLRSLEDLNRTIGAEAINLTQALRGDNKIQGDWGEMILERILQDSGLTEGTHYSMQESFTSENGRQRPDAIIRLPDSKHLIIDSKVSLKAYADWSASTDDIQREKLKKEHYLSVKAHMTGLSAKDYPSIDGISAPSFVIMFIPNDAAFMLAMQHDRTLYDQANKQRITIVGPSTLMAVMMTIDHIWKQENQQKNMLDIVSRGEALLDKFNSFMDAMDDLGQRLKQAENAYDTAHQRLYTGHGNLVRQAQQLKALGLKTKKELPEEL